MGQFGGFTQLEQTHRAVLQLTDNNRAPVNPDAAPKVRVYGQAGLLSNTAATANPLHSGTVTGATNASPVVVASVGHSLQTGDTVTIAGILGNTAANGTFVVTRVDADHFSLNGSTGNGNYSSGGAWNVTGLYYADIPALGANGFEVAETFVVYWSWQVSGLSRADLTSFEVT